MKICYEYKIQKTAYLPDGKNLVPVGVFEEHSRDGDKCRMVVKIFAHVPKELVDLIKEMPQLLQMREVKQKADTILLMPEGHDVKF